MTRIIRSSMDECDEYDRADAINDERWLEERAARMAQHFEALDIRRPTPVPSFLALYVVIVAILTICVVLYLLAPSLDNFFADARWMAQHVAIHGSDAGAMMEFGK